jgi:hypothetical protein
LVVKFFLVLNGQKIARTPRAFFIFFIFRWRMLPDFLLDVLALRHGARLDEAAVHLHGLKADGVWGGWDWFLWKNVRPGDYVFPTPLGDLLKAENDKELRALDLLEPALDEHNRGLAGLRRGVHSLTPTPRVVSENGWAEKGWKFYIHHLGACLNIACWVRKSVADNDLDLLQWLTPRFAHHLDIACAISREVCGRA